MKNKRKLNELSRKLQLSSIAAAKQKMKKFGPFIIFFEQELYKNQISMPKKQQRTSTKRCYARISLKKRKLLVQMVTEQGQTIANSIKKLRLKLTTARLILQKYKETGTFPMRKFKKAGKMLLDLKEKPVKVEYMDDDGMPEGRYQLQTVKIEFQSERELEYLLKTENNCEYSSADSGLQPEVREGALK